MAGPIYSDVGGRVSARDKRAANQQNNVALPLADIIYSHCAIRAYFPTCEVQSLYHTTQTYIYNLSTNNTQCPDVEKVAK